MASALTRTELEDLVIGFTDARSREPPAQRLAGSPFSRALQDVRTAPDRAAG